MVRRKRNSFARIGIVCVALIMALGLTGVGYSLWSDTITIDTTVEMGSWDGCLSDPSPTEGTITLGTAANVLTVTLSGASANTIYSGSFKVNNAGTLPVKIASITPEGTPAGVSVSIGGVGVGTVIEVGEVKTGNITVTTGDPAPPDGSFTETFEFVLWNQ